MLRGGRSRLGRSVAAMMAVVGLCSLAGLVVLPGAQAQKVSNPGTFTITPNLGSISIRNTVFDLTARPDPQCSDGVDNDGDGFVDLFDGGCTSADDDSELVGGHQPKVDVSITGEITADGAVTVPTSGIVFPPGWVPVPDPFNGPPHVVKATVTATDPATGVLDPLTGKLDLKVKLQVQLEGQPLGVGLGWNCKIGRPGAPIELNLTTGISGTLTGTPYSPTFGTARLVDGNFAVPGASGCPVGAVNLNQVINDQIGLPSPSGLNKATIQGGTSPILGRAITPRIVTDPGDPRGPAPLTITFDGGASTVEKGPATYRWSFPDGTTVEGVKITKSFDTVGTHTVTLTVTDADGDSATATKNVSVQAGPTGPSVPEDPGPSVPEDPGPSVPEDPGPSVPEDPGPSVPEDPGPSVPEDPGPSVPEDPGPSVPSGRDRATISITGRTTYANGGESTDGDVRVVRDAFGVVSAWGRLTLPGASGGEASVTVEVQRFWIFQLWTGQVSVYDPGAGVSVAAPVFGQVHSAAGANAVAGSSSWFTLGSFPDLIRPFTLNWSVDDVS